MSFFGFRYIDDIRQVNENEVQGKIQLNTSFSPTYIALLMGSSVICTLGLLLGASPVVIGGMIISPLMWPLMKVSLGVSYERGQYIRQALLLFFISVVVTLASAALVTLVSPIKLVNSEILARTNPTLLDLIVALIAGFVATLAISQPRVSESLAGVAIATSLMPPLAVSGIGLALWDSAIFTGAFLLFIANVVAIIFVSTLTFSYIGLTKPTQSPIRREGLLFIFILLVITAIPLFYLMRNYSFKTVAYHEVQRTLSKSLKEVSSNIYVDSVKTEVTADDTVLVDAQLLVPGDITIDYQQQQDIISALETTLGKEVDLNLRLQRMISVVGEKDRLTERKRDILSNTFSEEIQNLSSSLTISSLQIKSNEAELAEAGEEGALKFSIDAILIGDPSLSISPEERAALENILSEKVEAQVFLNLELISRIKLQSDNDLEGQDIKSEIRILVGDLSGEVGISSISLKVVSEESALTALQLDIRESTASKVSEGSNGTREKVMVSIELKVPLGFVLDENFVSVMKNYLDRKFGKNFVVTINTFERTTYSS